MRLFIYPILFAVSPVLFLFANNMSAVSFLDMVRPLIIIVVGTVLLLFVASYLTTFLLGKYITFAALLFFFSYGHLTELLRVATGLAGETTVWLLLVWLILFVGVLYGVIYFQKRLLLAERMMDVAVLIFAIIIVFFGSYNGIFRGRMSSEQVIAHRQETLIDRVTPLPDIYYIIMDGHARADILQEMYGYDNSAFLDALVERGFYIAQNSHSNYSITHLSLASALNMTYLDTLSARYGSNSTDTRVLAEMIRNSIAADVLRQRGYQMVAFQSGIHFTEISDADVYLVPRWSLSEFEYALIATTPLPDLFFELNKLLGFVYDFRYDVHRNRLLYILNTLPKVADMEGPQFVFAHLAVPHPPFVFGPSGEMRRPHRNFRITDSRYFIQTASVDEYRKGYREQLAFIDQQILIVIDEIFSRSAKPPVIILQSDHGPASALGEKHPYELTPDERETILPDYYRERMSILNAFYVPGDSEANFYSDITPVNTFRAIFNDQFGDEYPLLEDASYYSPWDYPYAFTDVTPFLYYSGDSIIP